MGIAEQYMKDVIQAEQLYNTRDTVLKAMGISATKQGQKKGQARKRPAAAKATAERPSKKAAAVKA